MAAFEKAVKEQGLSSLKLLWGFLVFLLVLLCPNLRQNFIVKSPKSTFSEDTRPEADSDEGMNFPFVGEV